MGLRVPSLSSRLGFSGDQPPSQLILGPQPPVISSVYKRQSSLVRFQEFQELWARKWDEDQIFLLSCTSQGKHGEPQSIPGTRGGVEKQFTWEVRGRGMAVRST